MLTTAALDIPFLLLPFRPSSDPSAARNFVRNFFKSSYDGTGQFTGEGLSQELRLAEPLVGSIALPSTHPASLLTQADSLRHHKMVLEPTARRCCHLGRL